MATVKDAILAIDVGTQSTRALAFDGEGRLLDKARAVYDPPYRSPQPGWAEQDPEYFWERVGTACRTLWAQGVVSTDRIAAVAMTFQRGTPVNLDESRRPLRPAIVWLDQRRSANPPPLPAFWTAALGAAGALGVVRRFQAEAEANWIAEHQPEIARRTRHYLLLSGYVTMRMTGEARDSVACTVGYFPFDFKALAWAAPSDWKWKALAVDPATLPQLVQPGMALGEVTTAAAAHTGLPAGLPVISAGSDKACEVLGSGCLEPHEGCIGYGTTATLNVDSPRYVEPLRLVPPYPSAQPGRYNVEYQVFRGFWMVTWFKEQFAALEQQRAAERGIAPESLLEELAAEVPPGSLGLTLQPYWTPGLVHPGPEGKGAIVGFGEAHHKHHMYRALLEGLAYEMRNGRERIEARTKTPLSRLVLCGGGSRSDLVMQITADVFGMTAHRPSCEEASGLGAAILGAVGAGLHRDLPTAVRAMTGTGTSFDPVPAHVKRYDDLYRAVYQPLYGRLQPLYRAMRAITGYPPPP
jgi:sugar (pentulose or hexulose) kinase